MHGDGHIWNEFLKGNEQAFDRLYNKYFPLLYNYGIRLCDDDLLVQDCIQELFVEIWQKQTRLNQVYSVNFYLAKSLRRKVLKQLKPTSKQREETLGQDNFEIELSHEASLIFHEVDKETRNKLTTAINGLSGRKKEIIFLKFYQNLSYKEIAELMGFSNERYARQLTYRTLDELRGLLKEADINVSLSFAISLIIIAFT